VPESLIVVLAAFRISPARAGAADARTSDHVLSILDACDGPTVAAQGVDCSRTSGVMFWQFIAEL